MPWWLLFFFGAVDQGVVRRDAAGNVTELDLTSAWVTDADMAQAGRMTHLRKLVLAHTKVTDAGLEMLKNLREVRDLDLYYAEYMSEDGIGHLRGWNRLERLNLRGTRVTSKVFEHLGHCANLRRLDLSFTQIDDDGFEHLAGLSKLESLGIGGNRLTGSSLPLLKLMPALVELDAGGVQRVDSGLWGLALNPRNLARLGELTGLRRLHLGRATINDRGVDRPGHPEAERSELRDLSALRGLVNLEYLDLTRQPVTAEALKSLSGLERLRELRLGLTAKLDRGALAALPAVEVIYLNGDWIRRSR